MTEEQPNKRRRLTCDYSKIPNEIWAVVCKYLPVSDIANLSQTNKNFYGITREEALWLYLYVRDFPDLPLPEKDFMKKYISVNSCRILGVTLEKVWKGFDLPNRPCNGTYDSYTWDEMPPLNKTFDGTFSWMSKSIDKTNENSVRQIQESANVILPSDLITFISSQTLTGMILSPTACWVVERLPHERFHDGFLFEFYCDQQGCVHWYSYFENKNGKCVNRAVLTSWYDADELIQLTANDLRESLFWCARSVEEFIYRVHMENTIWMKNYDNSLTEKTVDFTEEEKAYLNFYEDNKEMLGKKALTMDFF